MSRTYDLVCEDCNEGIWVGQKSSTGVAFYSGCVEVMSQLGRFMFKHEDHELRFMDGESDKALNCAVFEESDGE